MSEPRRLSNPPEGERQEGEERESECNKGLPRRAFLKKIRVPLPLLKNCVLKDVLSDFTHKLSRPWLSQPET